MKKHLPFFAVVLAMFIWGTVGIFRKSIDMPSSVVSLARGIVGCAVLLLLRLFVKKNRNRDALKKHMWLLIATGGTIGLNWVFFFEAQKYTAVSTATLCYYLAPTIIVLLSPVCFGEKLTVKKFLCAVCALLGMFVLTGIGKGDALRKNDAVGVAFGLAAAVMYALIVILNKKMPDVDALDRTTWQLGSSVLVLVPYILLTGDFASCSFSYETLLRLVIIGAVHTGIAYALYFYAVVKLPAQTAAIVSYIDPVTAVILSQILLHETMDVYGYIGAFLILGSAFVAEWHPKNKEV